MYQIFLTCLFIFSIQAIQAQTLTAFTNEFPNSNEQRMSLLNDSEGNTILFGNVTLYPDITKERYHSDGFGIWKYKSLGKNDSQFGDAGYVYHQVNDSIKNFASLTAITPDNKILVLASFKKLKKRSVYDAQYRGINLFKFNADGRIDTSFGNNGLRTFDLDQNYNWDIKTKGLKILEDGKILLMASTGASIDRQANRLIVCKLLPDGSLDKSFGENGIASDELEVGLGSMPINMVLDSENRILVSSYYIGEAKGIKSSGRYVGLRRFLANGALDKSFGDQGKQLIYTLEKHFALTHVDFNSKGDLIVAGVYHRQQGEIDVFITSFDLSRKINPVLEENKIHIFDVKGKVNDLLKGMEILENDDILLYGDTGKAVSSTTYDRFFFTKIKNDFRLDASFGNYGILIHSFEEGIGGSIQNHIKTDSGFLFTGTLRPKEFKGKVDAFIIELENN